MGTLVTSTSKNDTKPNYAVTSPLFGAVAVADGAMAVFVGADITTQTEASAGIQQCLQAIRDAHWPNPTAGNTTDYYYETATGSRTATLSESCVAVIVGNDYNYAGSSNSGHVHRLYEVALEQVLKAA